MSRLLSHDGVRAVLDPLRAKWRGIRARLGRHAPHAVETGDAIGHFESLQVSSYDEFQAVARSLALDVNERRDREFQIAEFGKEIRYDGHCAVCKADTTFSCNWDIYRTLPDGRQEPAWREALVCEKCGFNSRIRAVLHFMEYSAGLKPESAVYLSEQTTPLFAYMKQTQLNLVGSEYLGPDAKKGHKNLAGVRHEDVTDLTFSDEAFDIVGSNEVLEHVPDYRKALREMQRVLKPGGHLVITFPFRPDLYDTLVRARLKHDGEIEHLTEPEYHGDPMSQAGVLCFYHFGWDVLDAMREAGFSHASCHYYWSWENGYLGGAMPLFHAVK